VPDERTGKIWKKETNKIREGEGGGSEGYKYLNPEPDCQQRRMSRVTWA
jgi:hypothetical protein